MIKIPILSICVPTRNRAPFLRMMMDSLLPQVALIGNDEVQIVVSNNASEDETDDVIAGYNKNGIRIEYYKQSTNIGHANLDFVLSKARGKYILLSGDDDIYSPNFIWSVLPFLRRDEDFSILHWNRLVGDENCSNNKIYTKKFETPIVEYSSFKEFIIDTLSSSNFISSFIFNSQCWNNVPQNLVSEKWDGYNMWGRICLGASMHNQRCIFYYFPLVIQRVPSIREWNSKWPYYAIFELSDIFKLLDTFVPGIYSAWNNRLHDENFYRIKRYIDCVANDVDFYRKHKEDMLLYMNEDEKKQFLDRISDKNNDREDSKSLLVKAYMKFRGIFG